MYNLIKRIMGSFYKIGFIVIAAMLIFLVFDDAYNPTEYLVEITFCDNRPPKQIVVQTSFRPSSRDIINEYQRPVTTYQGYLNVCEVSTIKKLK